MDFVSIQFYNNPPCNLGSTGFFDSVKQWSSELGSNPRLLIGAPTFEAAASSGGFVDLTQYRNLLAQVRRMGVQNLGGAMFWDGAHDLGGSYRQTAKEVLQ